MLFYTSHFIKSNTKMTLAYIRTSKIAKAVNKI
jgi:hypothetical protein